MKKFTTVIFDYGGVIEVRPPGKNIGTLDLLSQELDFDIDVFKNLYFQNNHKNNIEGWTQKQTLLHVVSLLDDTKVQKASVVLDEHYSLLQTNFAILEVASAVKQQGYIVALLSNYNSEILRPKMKENGSDKIFDSNIFISSELTLQKPDPQIFNIVFTKLGVTPGECIFIDDSSKSLSTADEVGYVPLQFKSNQQLLVDLQRLGVRLT
jgi:HAD superfamily hydrolase (TIGR01509 family)